MTAPASSPGPSRRRMLAAVGAGTAAAMLAACSGRLSAEPGHVVAFDASGIVLPDLEPVEIGGSHVLEILGAGCRVTGILLQRTLPRSAAVALGFLADDPDAKAADDDQEVRAPAGEVFLVAEVRMEWSTTFGPGTTPPGAHSERLVVGGTPGETWPRPLEPGHPLTIACTVPADPAPDAVVLEMNCRDSIQRLSLVDGTRLSSDLEHWYQQWYQAIPDPVWWERTDEAAGQEPVMAGAVRSVAVRPALDDGTWPPPGEVLIGVDLEVLVDRTELQEDSGIRPKCDLVLLLPDGSEAVPLGTTSEVVLTGPPAALPMWFEVPHDVSAVTARITPSMRTADDREVDLGVVEIPVEVRAVPR